MKIPPFLSLIGVTRILVCQIECVHLQAQEIAFTNLPSIQELNYRVEPYIKVAAQLQAMGQIAATRQLLKLANRVAATGSSLSSLEDEQRTAILCRMLFTNKPGSDFERPAFLGAPSFLGGEPPYPYRFGVTNNYPNWPSEPIEIVDGIPFAVVTGYGYEGTWDSHAAESYVHYCMANCVWSSFHFAMKSEAEKQQAVRKLIASSKWREPPRDGEQQYLKEQIQ